MKRLAELYKSRKSDVPESQSSQSKTVTRTKDPRTWTVSCLQLLGTLVLS